MLLYGGVIFKAIVSIVLTIHRCNFSLSLAYFVPSWWVGRGGQSATQDRSRSLRSLVETHSGRGSVTIMANGFINLSMRTDPEEQCLRYQEIVIGTAGIHHQRGCSTSLLQVPEDRASFYPRACTRDEFFSRSSLDTVIRCVGLLRTRIESNF